MRSSAESGQEQRKQRADWLKQKYPAALGMVIFLLYFIRQNVDHSCHPNSHLYSTVQLTKHLVKRDHLKYIVSGEMFAKTIVSPSAVSM